MCLGDLSLTELKFNRDLTYRMDLKHALHFPYCYLFPQLPPLHLLQDNWCCQPPNNIFLTWKKDKLTAIQNTIFPFLA